MDWISILTVAGTLVSGVALGKWGIGGAATPPADITNKKRWAALSAVNSLLLKYLPGVTPAEAAAVTTEFERLFERVEARSKTGSTGQSMASSPLVGMPMNAEASMPSAKKSGSVTGIPDTHALVSLPALVALFEQLKPKDAATTGTVTSTGPWTIPPSPPPAGAPVPSA